MSIEAVLIDSPPVSSPLDARPVQEQERPASRALTYVSPSTVGANQDRDSAPGGVNDRARSRLARRSSKPERWGTSAAGRCGRQLGGASNGAFLRVSPDTESVRGFPRNRQGFNVFMPVDGDQASRPAANLARRAACGSLEFLRTTGTQRQFQPVIRPSRRGCKLSRAQAPITAEKASIPARPVPTLDNQSASCSS